MYEMKRGIYIYSGADDPLCGVEKKIGDQIKAFSKYYKMHTVVVRKETTNPIKSVLRRLPAGSWGADYDRALKEIKSIADKCNQPLFFYIRKLPLDRKYARFLRELKETQPDSSTLLEIPTYPYDKELLQNRTMWPWFFKDHAYRIGLCRYVDRIVTFSEDKAIFGIPTIRIQNGIVVDDIELGVEFQTENNHYNCLNLITVAQFQPGHGYDRVIRSLYKYYEKGGKRNIILNMVGYGTELEKYRHLTKRLGMEEHVVFHGKKSGTELASFLNRADIGLDAFAAYRQGITISSSLKVREYLAYGLPVVSGCREDVFEDADGEFFLEFSDDDSDIDVERITEFYDDLHKKYPYGTLKKHIREFAKENVDMDVTLQPVFEYINGADKEKRG